MDGLEQRRSGRTPLLREGADRAVAAARPPTASVTGRDTTEAASTRGSADASTLGAGTSAVEESMQKRVCCVCMAKPLQVVLIPCGHACLCRKCSRKVDSCPLCRLEIQATQVKREESGAEPRASARIRPRAPRSTLPHAQRFYF
jgi:hypothetical protein